VIGDPDPAYDDCSDSNHTSTNSLLKMSGTNIGDRLNQENVTWAGSRAVSSPPRPTPARAPTPSAGATHANVGGATVVDYSPHTRRSSTTSRRRTRTTCRRRRSRRSGTPTRPTTNYDLSDFSAAVGAGNLPAVSFLKAPEYQDGHAAYSDPIDEQHFLVSTITSCRRRGTGPPPPWSWMYDDSDGWYDHASAPLPERFDRLGPGRTGLPGGRGLGRGAGGYLDRCGPGQRQPLLVISPSPRRTTSTTT